MVVRAGRDRDPAAAVTGSAVREAYRGAAGSWQGGPDLVYDALAGALLAHGPAWRGLRVLDVGAGTGTAARRLADAGADVVATDTAASMLAVARGRCACRPFVADAAALPVRDATVDAVVMGFVLNHLAAPATALAEAARVTRPGGWVLASTWSRTDDHPVRGTVEAALVARGWRPPGWYVELRTRTAPLTDTARALAAVARGAGLAAVRTDAVDVAVPASSRDLVAWRLGMPHTAPFVAALPRSARDALRAELADAVGALPPLACRILVLVSRATP